ncbi:vitamin K epoxide reductase family protein [Candidatus Woesearchaeota archaeon]|nr:vitamin K epoxide reductase family protein [Candidatus Woesearchaeota archaeon]
MDNTQAQQPNQPSGQSNVDNAVAFETQYVKGPPGITKKPFIIAIVLLGIAFVIAAYLTYVHYAHAAVFCPLGDAGQCAAVLGSRYSSVLGVPVSLLGLALYTYLLYCSVRGVRKPQARYLWRIWFGSALALVAAGYFNFIMLFKTGFCPWCETLHLIEVPLFYASGSALYAHRERPKSGLWIVLAVAVFIGLASAVVATAFVGDETDAAKCLAAKGVRMYGAFWCPHCNEQKELFGKAFEMVDYVECSTADGKGQTDECKAANITGYPTWERADGARLTATQEPQKLAEWVGC